MQASKSRQPASASSNDLVGPGNGDRFGLGGLLDLRRDLAELFDMDANEIALAPCKGDAADEVFPDNLEHEAVGERVGSRHANLCTCLRDVLHIAGDLDTLECTDEGNPVCFSAWRPLHGRR
jgi:hypothetical protein